MPRILPYDLTEAVIRLLLALLALALLALLRTLMARLLATILARLTRRPSDAALFNIVILPVRFLLLALGIDLAARILGLDSNVVPFIGRLTRTLVIVALYAGIYQAINEVASSRGRLFAATRIIVEDALLPFVRTGLHLVLLAITLVIVIQIWGYDVSGLIAGLGLGGLAFSLAAQDTIANLFGFSMIVGDRPFVVGEYVVTPDVEGVVERVGLRSTRIRQNNQALVTVPNNKIANSTVVNWSRLSKRWIDLRLPISYRHTAEEIEGLLERLRAMLKTRDSIDAESVVVQFVDFEASALIVLVRGYVFRADWLEFTQEKEKVYLEILRIVAEMDIEIAFPSQAVYIRKLPDLSREFQAAAQIFEAGRQTADGLQPAGDSQGEQR